jgi:hypothetical protein
VRSRELVCVSALTFLVVCAQACSLFSGWSDLEDGAASSVDAGQQEEEDAGRRVIDASPRDTATDTGVDANPVDAGFHCSAANCAPQTCCVGVFNPTPSCAASCSTVGAIELRCAGASDCPGGVCCYSQIGRVAQCQAVCPPSTSFTVCNPNDPEPCGPGATCSPRSSGDTLGLNTCQ